MLSKISAGEPIEGTWLYFLQEKSTTEEISILEAKEDWIKPIQNFILEEKLPEDETKSRKIHTTSARYALIHSQLYRILRVIILY